MRRWIGLSLFLIAEMGHITASFAQQSESVPSSAQIKALYGSLDPTSLSKHLAFYQLYPRTRQGQAALKTAWHILSRGSSIPTQNSQLPTTWTFSIDALLSLINKHVSPGQELLSEEELRIVDAFAAHLPNRSLAGYQVWEEEKVLALPPEEIDLARGLFLTQLGEHSNYRQRIRSYEAMIDLMALQIAFRLPPQASPQQKIRAINDFIFYEMGFRFPPHSQHIKEIDLYTFLPSVLDSRRGVCLGVSILYICLAQRLHLPLEMVTPPGHIYIRYRDGSSTINIETTARGIHLDDDVYLGIDTRSLQQRTIKEVIGLAHFNQASVYWKEGEHPKALDAYTKAQRYMPQDKFLQELMAYNYLFVGETEKGERILNEVKDDHPDFKIKKMTLSEDYLQGAIDKEGIRVIFTEVDETRVSLLNKKEELEKVIEKYPHFRMGLMSLATTWLQLFRQREALEVLEKLHAIDPEDPTTEYYLAVLYAARSDFNRAWHHLRLAEKIVHSHEHAPRSLKQLRKELTILFPE